MKEPCRPTIEVIKTKNVDLHIGVKLLYVTPFYIFTCCERIYCIIDFYKMQHFFEITNYLSYW